MMRNEYSPFSFEKVSTLFTDNLFGLSSLRRLLRELEVPYYDNFNARQNSQRRILDVNPDVTLGVSVRKSVGKDAETSSIIPVCSITQTYLEVCILSHPALKSHPYIPELLGVTLISPIGDSLAYEFGLITNEFHGTLEDLFVVERKESRDPRPYLISWTEREEIVLQCAEGLAALHDCNILHNNIQPSSFTVYITYPSPSTRIINVKISNFGHIVPLTAEIIVNDVPLRMENGHLSARWRIVSHLHSAGIFIRSD